MEVPILLITAALCNLTQPALQDKRVGQVLAMIQEMPSLSDTSKALEIEGQCSCIAKFDTKTIDLAMRQYLRPLNSSDQFLGSQLESKGHQPHNVHAFEFYRRASQVSRALSRYLFLTESAPNAARTDMWNFTFPCLEYEASPRGPIWPWSRDRKGQLKFTGHMNNDFVHIEATIYGPMQDFEAAEKLPRR